MDAQVAWDPLGTCSCWHGVTSVVMSNCGFALAPCKPEDRDWYARCLSAVEDIPTAAMAAGIDWTWETFPEYLATVERLPKAINYGMYIGHSALRMYVMGRRALSEKATEDDMTRMAAAVKEALRAGAMGFSSSRASTHVTPDDTPVASRIAEWEEIDRIVAAMAELDAGIFQVGPDIASGAAHRAFLARLREVALAYKRPIMFGVLATKQGDDPTGWAYQTRYIDETVAAGGRMFGQGTTRSINAIFSLKSYLPFDVLPAWRKIRDLPMAEQKRRLADPEVRRELVAAEERMKPRDNVFQGGGAATTDPRKPDYSNLFAMNGVDWDDPTVEQLARSARTASGRSHDRPVAGQREPGLCPAAGQRIAGRRAGHPEARPHARDLLRFRRPCGAGDGLVAADAPAELLGAQAWRLHARAGGQEDHRTTMPRPGTSTTAA